MDYNSDFCVSSRSDMNSYVNWIEGLKHHSDKMGFVFELINGGLIGKEEFAFLFELLNVNLESNLDWINSLNNHTFVRDH